MIHRTVSPRQLAALLLRVFAVDASPEPGRDPSSRPRAASGQREEPVDLGPSLWECVIDVGGLTALPAGSRMSHLWTLPADCMLVEMSNGALYAPGLVGTFGVVLLSIPVKHWRGEGNWGAGRGGRNTPAVLYALSPIPCCTLRSVVSWPGLPYCTS